MGDCRRGRRRRRSPSRQGAHRGRRSVLLLRRGEARRGREDQVPRLQGPGRKEAVLKHIKTKVIDWMKKKRPAIEKAQEEYLKIVQLQPTPPPAWVIAAGSQVGGLWGNFVASSARRRSRPTSRRTPSSATRTTARSTRRREPDKSTREGRVRDVPRVLGHLPVLRRVLAQLRGLARRRTTRPSTTPSTSSAASPTMSDSGLNDRLVPAAVGRRSATTRRLRRRLRAREKGE